MFFSNIIYFIIVLLIFNFSYSGGEQTASALYCLSMTIACWMVLVLYCRIGFRRLTNLCKQGLVSGQVGRYNRLVLRLSIIAILIFSLDVFSFHLSYWIDKIPGFSNFYVPPNLVAIILFLFYLSTIWYFAHSAYRVIFNSDIERHAFIQWNIKLNIPILFPWLFIALAYDLISLCPWPEVNAFFNRPVGEIIFLGVLLLIAMIYIPVIIQYFWGCESIEASEKTEAIKIFLKDMGLKYRDFVRWPLFGGRMMTAGIMGVIPRYRYVLITDSLLEILTVPELKAVMAHEAGHAKYQHLLIYVIFIFGFLIIALGFSDPSFYFTVIGYILTTVSIGAVSGDLILILSSIPLLLSLIIYFRFIMGFFMRNFERQADTYSAMVMGNPGPIISSLEKIAMLGGKIRDVPSWHHFSIRQRVDFLNKSYENPDVIKHHRRLLLSSFSIYLAGVLSIAYLLYFTPVKMDLSYYLLKKVLIEKIEKRPGDLKMLEDLARIYQQTGEIKKAAATYEKILHIDRKQPTFLNNLAWILITTDDMKLRDIKRGLALAKEAVALDRNPLFLDTLAEAYWLNGNSGMAVKLEKEAIERAKTDYGYYIKQLYKFKGE